MVSEYEAVQAATLLKSFQDRYAVTYICGVHIVGDQAGCTAAVMFVDGLSSARAS